MDKFIKTLAGIIGGMLMMSGSGLIEPLDFFNQLGLSTDKQFFAGGISAIIACCLHVLMGGNLFPERWFSPKE